MRDELQTISWFHFVRLTLGETAPGAIAKRAQIYFDGRGIESNHCLSKRWYRYRDGLETPNASTLKLVDEIAPGSLDFFHAGPGDLWHAMWPDRIERWSEDHAEQLFTITQEEMDFVWLSKLILTWTKRAELVSSGVPGTLVDGFYEAIHVALNRVSIKESLKELGVWSRLVDIITSREAYFLRCDWAKSSELHAVAVGCGIEDAVETYVGNPLRFLELALQGLRSSRESPAV